VQQILLKSGGSDVHISSLIKRLLNVNDIVIKDVKFETDRKGEEILVIAAEPPKRQRNRCPICGKKAKGYDSGNGVTRWRSMDLGSMRVYIEAPAPRICCKKHGVLVAKVPWARHHARFTHDFEDTVAWLMLHSSKTVISNLQRIAWNTVGDIVKRVHDDIKKRTPNMFDGLSCIGIDETSYKKGHKYMTVIVDHTTGKLIWAAPKHGKTVLASFFELLTPEQRLNIKHVTADGAKWIAECVAEYCPNAERSIDPFHVVQWATDILDDVRRGAWRDARKEVHSQKSMRSIGRPKKGAPKPEQSKADAVKGARYALLKNPDTLTAVQEVMVEIIAQQNPELYRAYLLKEKLRLIFKLPLQEAISELDAWIKWAQHCRIPQFVELQRKIRRHYDAILSSIKYGLSNARIEAMNNKIKLTVRMGYGFRNIDNLIALVMLRCSKVDLQLPGRA
jgi:transposase